jgi:hypothetical protein
LVIFLNFVMSVITSGDCRSSASALVYYGVNELSRRQARSTANTTFLVREGAGVEGDRQRNLERNNIISDRPASSSVLSTRLSATGDSA